jgi:DNA-binding NarL/FixJ family response regulator
MRFLECLERNNHNRTRTAKELGVSVRSVRNWLKAMGLGVAPHKPICDDVPRDKPWTKDEVETLIALGKRGHTYKEIAHALQRTVLSCKGKARELYRKQKQKQALARVHLTAENIRRQRIFGLRSMGVTVRMIAKDLGLDIEVVKKHLSDWRQKP